MPTLEQFRLKYQHIFNIQYCLTTATVTCLLSLYGSFLMWFLLSTTIALLSYFNLIYPLFINIKSIKINLLIFYQFIYICLF